MDNEFGVSQLVSNGAKDAWHRWDDVRGPVGNGNGKHVLASHVADGATPSNTEVVGETGEIEITDVWNNDLSPTTPPSFPTFPTFRVQ